MNNSKVLQKLNHKRRANYIQYLICLFGLAFFIFAFYYLDIDLQRFATMFGPLKRLFAHRMYPPELTYLKNTRYLQGVLITIYLSITATAVGITISAILAWLASFNATPNKRLLYPASRFIIMLARSIHVLIWALLFTHIFGFGPLPGFMALTMLTIGFAGKLFAEEIEAIRPGPVEAMRSTGQNSIRVFLFGVFPQVRVAWTGITVYNWDSSFRASTIVGYVGAGGMGLYLREAIQFFQYRIVLAILLNIIVLVIISEVISAKLRSKLG